MLLALDFLADVPKEIVIVTPASRAEAEPFLAKLREAFLPNAVLVVVAEGAPLAALEKVVPLVSSKIAKGGLPATFDQISVGQSWLNEDVVRLVWREGIASAASPA